MSDPSAPPGRRKFERSEVRPGFLMGVAAAIIVAILFALRWPSPVARLDYGAVDYFFQLRPAPPPGNQVVMVYIDDASARQFGRPKRRDTAGVIRGLSRLGAKAVVLDIEYVTDFSALGPDGAVPIDEETRVLARAMEASGRASLIFNLEHPPEAADTEVARRVIGQLRANLAAEPDSLPGLSPEDRPGIEAIFPELRQLAAHERVLEVVAAEPSIAFPELRRRLLSDRDAARDGSLVRDLARAFHAAGAMRVLREKGLPLETAGLPARIQREGMVKATVPDLAAAVFTAGNGTTPVRDDDGVLRRSPVVIDSPYGPVVYLGIVAAARMLEDADHRAVARIEPGGMSIELRPRGGGPASRRMTIPLLPDGSCLADWVPSLPSISYARIWNEDYRRCDLLAQNLVRALDRASNLDRETALHLPDLKTRLEEIRGAGKAGAAFAEMDEDLRRFADPLLAILRAEVARERAAVAKAPPARRADLSARLEMDEDVVAGLEPAFSDDLKLRELVAGKICFVGSNTTALGDLYVTPMGGREPGVNLHANLAAMVLEGRSLRYAAPWLNFLLIAGVGTGVAAGVASWTLLRGSVFTASLIAGGAAAYIAVGMKWGVLLSGAGPTFSGAAAFTVAVSWRELVARRSQRRLQKELARHTSPDLVSIIMADPERFSRPRKTAATIFFSDIKGFTGIGEKMDAEQLITYMNRYHDRMTKILMDRQAYLDKYIGDGIMALFGVPVETAEHAKLACYAALESVTAAARLTADLEREGRPPISIRVGLNSGDIVAAYVGASDRADYTAIGDAVNLASRLEGANKNYGTQIMVGEATFELTRHAFWYRELDVIRVVGKKKGIRVYELLAQKGVDNPFPEGFLTAYHDGIGDFERRDWSAARRSFVRALEIFPEDAPAKLYVARCDGFLARPPAADWDGVFDLSTK